MTHHDERRFDGGEQCSQACAALRRPWPGRSEALHQPRRDVDPQRPRDRGVARRIRLAAVFRPCGVAASREQHVMRRCKAAWARTALGGALDAAVCRWRALAERREVGARHAGVPLEPHGHGDGVRHRLGSVDSSGDGQEGARAQRQAPAASRHQLGEGARSAHAERQQRQQPAGHGAVHLGV